MSRTICFGLQIYSALPLQLDKNVQDEDKCVVARPGNERTRARSVKGILKAAEIWRELLYCYLKCTSIKEVGGREGGAAEKESGLGETKNALCIFPEMSHSKAFILCQLNQTQQQCLRF